MNYLKRIIYCLTLSFVLLSQQALADMVDKPKVERQFSYGEHQGELKRTDKGSTWFETLSWKGKKIIKYQRDHMRTKLYSMELIKPKDKKGQQYLVMTWIKGAHSQTLEVWSVSDRLIKLWEETSYYAGYTTTENNNLIVTYSRDSMPYPKEISRKFPF
jgi:hypothetical protein